MSDNTIKPAGQAVPNVTQAQGGQNADASSIAESSTAHDKLKQAKELYKRDSELLPIFKNEFELARFKEACVLQLFGNLRQLSEYGYYYIHSGKNEDHAVERDLSILTDRENKIPNAGIWGIASGQVYMVIDDIPYNLLADPALKPILNRLMKLSDEEFEEAYGKYYKYDGFTMRPKNVEQVNGMIECMKNLREIHKYETETGKNG